ncbi:MAG: AAA family ATPase [Candidatus Marsarchaeota archaeon]|jgi:putative ATP-dependent endonuclease of OLD family|nr:AAA family ATPase [Candidatus Marsarchaeota archaeon]
MKLREIKILNFRNLVNVNIPIDDTTILIGENNSGKTAFIEALKIALPYYINSRQPPFDEYDYYMSTPEDKPQTSKGIVIELWFREDAPGEWSDALIQDLNEIVQTDGVQDIDSIRLRLSSRYDQTSNDFNFKWEFLALDGQPLVGKSANSYNLTKFLSYIRLFYLSSLRDSNNEFSPRSQYWGRILRDLKISDEQKAQLGEELEKLNKRLLSADSRLEQLRESLGKVQEIMALGSGKNTTIHILPLKPWELMSKSEVAIKADGSNIEFPLSSYGQGTQSLSVLFLFQSYIDLLLKPTFKQETEAILTLEEPEAHLHPQTTRAIAANLSEIKSQKIISSHSPYFIQEIPFTNIRVFRRYGPSSKVFYIKRQFSANIPKNPELLKFCNGNSSAFEYKENTATLIVKKRIEKQELSTLQKSYPDQEEVKVQLKNLYDESQLYISDKEIRKLETFAKRIHGEALFARAWLLCEGQTEYLLLKYFAELMNKPLDKYGVTVIDYQNNGSPGIFVALSRTYGIPFIILTDSDEGKKKCIGQVADRGLTDEEIHNLVRWLPIENADLEMYLYENGFAQEYIEILKDEGIKLNNKSGDEKFKEEIIEKIRQHNHKLPYMHALIDKLKAKGADESRIPEFFKNAIIDIINITKKGNAE